jgi:para-nitrobenzyl esterase
MKRSLIQSVGLASLLSCLVWAQGQPPTESIATVFGTADQVDATPRNTSEDCLYLSVWTNNLGGQTPQPVMVWVHGG